MLGKHAKFGCFTPQFVHVYATLHIQNQVVLISVSLTQKINTEFTVTIKK